MLRNIISLSAHTYPVEIASNQRIRMKQICDFHKNRGDQIIVLIDKIVANFHSQYLKKVFINLPIITLTSNESIKSFTKLEFVLNFLTKYKLERNGILIAIGGGTLGDLVGFAAAIYLRGIKYYQIPTTLLAMVDSAIGGKTAINLKTGKNLVGAFHHPEAVIIDTQFLKTLPLTEFSAGMAEIIKYALIYDKKLLNQLTSYYHIKWNDLKLMQLIEDSSKCKSKIIEKDEKEKSNIRGRAILNFGHTFGHAIEAVTQYKKYSHGEAIGIGIVMAMRLSEEIGNISADEVNIIKSLIKTFGLPVKLKVPLSLKKLKLAMYRDKKIRAGRLRFVVLEKLGFATICDNIKEKTIDQLWIEFGAKE